MTTTTNPTEPPLASPSGGDPDAEHRANTLAHIQASEAAAIRLRRLAEDPAAPGSSLEILALAGDSLVREAAAAHPNTPSKMLHNLERDPVNAVRVALASNPALPTYLARSLAGDDSDDLDLLDEIHGALAANPATPSHVLATIARHDDADSSVVLAVVAHPNTSSDTLQTLAKWNEPEGVSAAAQASLDARTQGGPSAVDPADLQRVRVRLPRWWAERSGVDNLGLPADCRNPHKVDVWMTRAEMSAAYKIAGADARNANEAEGHQPEAADVRDILVRFVENFDCHVAPATTPGGSERDTAGPDAAGTRLEAQMIRVRREIDRRLVHGEFDAGDSPDAPTPADVKRVLAECTLLATRPGGVDTLTVCVATREVIGFAADTGGVTYRDDGVPTDWSSPPGDVVDEIVDVLSGLGPASLWGDLAERHSPAGNGFDL